MATSTPRINPTPTLLYDADCGFCQHCMKIFNKLNKKQRVHCVPLQNDTVREEFHVNFEQAAMTIHFVDNKNIIYSGAEGLSHAVDTALSTRFFTLIYYIPFIGFIEDKVYNLIARNRNKLPGSDGICAFSKISHTKNN